MITEVLMSGFIALATVTADVGQEVKVEIDVGSDKGMVRGILIDVEYDSSGLEFQYATTSGDRITVNDEVPCTNNEGMDSRLRALAFDLTPDDGGFGLNAITLHFVPRRPGAFPVEMTIGKPESDCMGYVAYHANLTVQLEDGSLWEIARDWPETGELYIQNGKVSVRGTKRPPQEVATEEHSWTQIKGLYR